MTNITDEYMQGMLATIKPYSLVLLKDGPNAKADNARQIIWEHGRRNFALRADGKISVVAPVTKDADVAGIYIFNTTEEEAAEIMKDDPGVMEGVFTFETYPIMSFPGDSLK